MPTAAAIIRCCKSDIGTSVPDLESAARYCEEIARNAALNPWSDPADAPAYAQAAALLHAEAQSSICNHQS